MNHNSLIYIAGHKGMVGSAIHRNLLAKGYNNILIRTHQELDLTRQKEVEDFFEKEKPEYVFLAAAKVGGIVANNTYRAEFIYKNLMIQSNIIHASKINNVKKLLFLGSSCIYPKKADQPLKEEYLLTAPLEFTNEPYAIAKIAGIKMCENYFRQYGSNFISVMPTNLYGPNDNYHLENSHVLPAMIRKMHLAHCLEEDNWKQIRLDLEKYPVNNINNKSSNEEILLELNSYGIRLPGKQPGDRQVSLSLWGTGEVYREFLHVEDMARACIFIMENLGAEKLYSQMGQSHINIGTGIDLTIKDLSSIVKVITGFRGQILWDNSKPDGTFKKQLDVSLLNSLGWKPSTNLKQGIEKVYSAYKEQSARK